MSNELFTTYKDKDLTVSYLFIEKYKVYPKEYNEIDNSYVFERYEEDTKSSYIYIYDKYGELPEFFINTVDNSYNIYNKVDSTETLNNQVQSLITYIDDVYQSYLESTVFNLEKINAYLSEFDKYASVYSININFPKYIDKENNILKYENKFSTETINAVLNSI